MYQEKYACDHPPVLVLFYSLITILIAVSTEKYFSNIAECVFKNFHWAIQVYNMTANEHHNNLLCQGGFS